MSTKKESMKTRVRRVAVACVAALALPALPVLAGQAQAAKPQAAPYGPTFPIHLLGINDFHGNLTGDGLKLADPATCGGPQYPAGSAAVLAHDLAQREAAYGGDTTLLVNAGDMVGGSPPESALLRDEPTEEVLNEIGMDVGTLGNHEFDKGVPEVLRQIEGGQSLLDPSITFPGMNFPMVSANVIDTTTNQPLLQPYVIENVKGFKIAFIGATTTLTPTITVKGATDGVRFDDPAEAVNRYVPELEKRNVNAIVLLIHEGGVQDCQSGAVDGTIADIAQRLDPQVDVVISGHSHTVINAEIAGHLVVQASSFGRAFDDVTLVADRRTNDIAGASAEIVPVWKFSPNTSTDPADAVPGDPAVAAIVQKAVDRVGPIINEVIGKAATDVTRAEDAAGESALGDLIADAQRASTGTQIAFMNEGGIRADLLAGDVTWGDLFTIQPFGNLLTTLDLTGAQIWTLLAEQFQPANTTIRNLQISGINYTWHQTGTYTGDITGVWLGTGPAGTGTPIANDDSTTYTVTVNNFMADGGDGFSVLTEGANRQQLGVDLDALVDYVATLPSPFDYPLAGRIALD